ncbi:mitochondrial import inner membrane translocase subunit Tim29-like [Lytechinus variegatus]|uniref:mitochondrial import inner membrane translocase subunit Tim29-like n=1 Tax=Lytechinus variegatus TaxID=7654 RepID=UPI001BB156FA|nr:mitochondrial import inner membrane translocase subunit Tim29-like [Lytechinus variegatus]
MAASMRQMLSRLSTAKEGLKVPGRLKTGLPKKIGDYLSNMYRDYRAATVDVFTDMKERPFKAAFYIATLSAIGYMWSQAPDEENFEIELVNASNDLLLLSNLTRNQSSDGHVQKLTALQNAGVLRFMNLGVCSLIWEDNFDKRVAMYDAKCDYLAVSWRELPDRIRDVGFLGRWHYLSKAMTDYDINEFEFQNAPSG